jgi:hypothetical protein
MIHEAERESGPSGAVLRGPIIDMAAAVTRRRAGEDVVVCGSDTDANRRLAYQLEAAVGPTTRPEAPHKKAGPMALPHFHQSNRSPKGHTFYETDRRKTKKKP